MSASRPIMLSEVAAKLELTPTAPKPPADRPVAGGLVGDLLSDVMAHGQPGQVWITVQGHANIVAVAALARLAAVIVAGGFQPEAEAIDRAEEEGVALFTSPHSTYTLAGQLYELGVR